MIDTETYLLVVPVHNSTDQPIAADVWIREESDGQTSYTSPARNRFDKRLVRCSARHIIAPQR